MVLKLNKQIKKGMEEWDGLKCMLAVHLDTGDIAAVANIIDVCSKLLQMDVIKYGQYKELKELFSSMEHKICCDIIDDYSKQIQDIQRQNLPTQQGLLSLCVIRR